MALAALEDGDHIPEIQHAILVAIGVAWQRGLSPKEEPEEVAGISAVDSPIAIRITRFSDLDDTPGPDVNGTGLIVHVKAALDGQATFDNSAHEIRLHHLSGDDTKDHCIAIDGPRHCPGRQTRGINDRYCPSE